MSENVQSRLSELERPRQPGVRRKPLGGPTVLTDRHLSLVRYIVHGCPFASVRQVISRPHPDADMARAGYRLPVEPNQPLNLIEAAILLRIRRRSARQLATYTIFQEALEKEREKKAAFDQELGSAARGLFAAGIVVRPVLQRASTENER